MGFFMGKGNMNTHTRLAYSSSEWLAALRFIFDDVYANHAFTTSNAGAALAAILK
jgi:hypothetical protein